MRKVSALLVAIVFTIPLLNSCKKGSEDPFISFRSREARLKGEWHLTSGTATITNGTVTTTKTFDGSIVSITSNGQTTVMAHTEKLEFLKDNVYKSTKTNDVNVETCEGYWAFMDGNGDEFSDKECIIIRFLSIISGGTVETYTGYEAPIDIFKLKKLSNSEMIIEYEGSSSGNSSSTTSIIKTYEKK